MIDIDKILFSVFFSALAGFLTAIVSIVKLVNEKESKTTDYRQGWTESVRSSLANLIALINTQVSQVISAVDAGEKLNNLHNSAPNPADPEARARLLSFHEGRLKDLQLDFRNTRKELYEAYALARLHFKPNDKSFEKIEKHFDTAMTMITDLTNGTNSALERTTLKDKVHGVTAEMTESARDILKTEWETVKRGEPAYETTKRWSIRGLVTMLALIVAVGLFSGFSIWKKRLRDDFALQADYSSSSHSSGDVIVSPTPHGTPPPVSTPLPQPP